MSDDGRYVYEIARDLGMSSKALRAEIEVWGLGWDVSHHMRRLDSAQCAELTRRLVGTSTEAPPARSRRRSAPKEAPAAPAPDAPLDIPAVDADDEARDGEDDALDPDDRPVVDDDVDDSGWAGTAAVGEAPRLGELIEAATAKARRKAHKAEVKAREALAAADQARALATRFLLRNKRKKAAEAKSEARKQKKKAKKRLAKAQLWAQRALDAASRLTGRGGDDA